MSTIITYSKRSRPCTPRVEEIPLKKPCIQSKKLKNQELTQLQLDLAPTQVTCKQCGMSFNKTSPTDSSLHKKFHAKATGGVDWPRTSSEVVWKDCNGNKIVVPSGGIEKRGLARLVSLVDSELGSVTTINDSMKAYAYIKGTKCIGLLLAESIEMGYKVLPEGMDSSCTTASDIKVEAIIGISRIWVSIGYRRLGVAWKLLDTARENFVYGMVIEKDKIAFSQPTDSGKRLIERWTGRQDFAVYVETYRE